jgi:GAF domain-containing protein
MAESSVQPGRSRPLREENHTLYSVIRLVSSSLELIPMLQGIVELATEATGCHACFIYLLEGEQLTIRAASPVFTEAVGKVQLGLDEGLTGWVARHRKPEFIREHALEDPRMKYVPLLEEERFQSMVAVPILSRAGDTIGVIVLHTEAPREFTEDTLTLLVHIASLVSGAIENAQNYDRERRRVDSLTGLSALAHVVASAGDVPALADVVTRGSRELMRAAACRLYRLDEDNGTVQLLAARPASEPGPESPSAADLLLDGELLTVSLSAGRERIGLLCAQPPSDRNFTPEDEEVMRAIAHLAAVAIKRLELIEGLTKSNIVKDLFEALAAGATEFAATKAAEVRCDLGRPYLLVQAEPMRGTEPASGAWRAAAEALGPELARLAGRSAIEAGPGPVRAILSFEVAGQDRFDEVVRRCRELGRQHGAVIGVAGMRRSAAEAARAFREARDGATIGRALLADGGAIAYAELGAYRYLVNIPPEEAPHDRMREAVDVLIEYDNNRRTALLDTLERYLTERRSVIESARELYIHPNTLRQRLGRIEELTGLSLDTDDLLSLELAIKLARLHGRPG